VFALDNHAHRKRSELTRQARSTIWRCTCHLV
jgi:hypothetical protein